jgi:hypothetical protein
MDGRFRDEKVGCNEYGMLRKAGMEVAVRK